jgi:hypothetical protein
MMRFSQLTWIGLGALLVLPTFSQDARKGSNAGLEGAISQTVGVLQELGGLQQSIEKGNRSSLARLLELTEPPILDAPARDRALAELRIAVSALQMDVDSSRTGTSHASAWEEGRAPGTAPLNLLALGRLPGASTQGLVPADGASDPTRENAIESTGTKAVEPRARANDIATRSLEPAGYSADLLRQVRLSILAGHADTALTLLDGAGASSEASYWRARALESLGEIQRAIDAYRLVTEDTKAPELAARAAQDLAFLEWKRDFDARRARKVVK